MLYQGLGSKVQHAGQDISTNSVGIHDAYVYIISEKGIEKGKDLFVGYLAEYNGDMYAINSLELYQHDEIEGGKSGENYLYRLDGKKESRLGSYHINY